MTRNELMTAINQRKTVIYDGSRYLAVGYKLLVRNNQKEYYAGVKDLRRDGYIWCGLEDIEVDETENE